MGNERMSKPLLTWPPGSFDMPLCSPLSKPEVALFPAPPFRRTIHGKGTLGL